MDPPLAWAEEIALYFGVEWLTAMEIGDEVF